MGPNGTGKSTLLKAITGQDGVKLTTGRMVLNDTCRVGYLEQKGVSGSTRTVQEEVRRTPSQIQKIQGLGPPRRSVHANVCDSNDISICMRDVKDKYTPLVCTFFRPSCVQKTRLTNESEVSSPSNRRISAMCGWWWRPWCRCLTVVVTGG